MHAHCRHLGMPPAGSEGPPHLVPSVVSGPSSSSSVLPAVTVFEARPFPVSRFDQSHCCLQSFQGPTRCFLCAAHVAGPGPGVVLAGEGAAAPAGSATREGSKRKRRRSGTRKRTNLRRKRGTRLRGRRLVRKGVGILNALFTARPIRVTFCRQAG